MSVMTRRMIGATAIAILFAGSTASAQAPQFIHGTIEKIDGATMTVKQTSGPDLTVKLADNAKIFGVKAGTAADVKQNDFIGVGAMPQPDGSQKALVVTIFSESQRGTNPGFRPWDKPGTTMTNGTADSTVASVDGQVVVVKYAGGQQKIIIGPDAKIRMYVAGTLADLKPGTAVAVAGPEKAADGTLQTARVNFGIGGQQP